MTDSQERSRYSVKEELANAISHFLGFLLSIIAFGLMLHNTIRHGDSIQIVTASVFGVSMMTLYLSSSLTHYLKQGRIKNFFFSMDKIAIYFLIAGTYTPLALVAIGGALGWTIFGIEWGCAVIGMALVLRKPVNFEKGVNILIVFSYALMGWLILIAIKTLINSLPLTAWLLILIGGAFYTIGIFFYKKGKFQYHHLVWHTFVLIGTAAHFITIYCFVLSH